jgi:ATP-dependent helicase/nuclease subunit B
MLRIVTGPFHPTLDRTLIDDVRSLKTADPFTPLAIVVPSSALVERLKRLLAVEAQLPLLNCHVLTFHQLALRLRDDLAWTGDATTALQLVDDFYFEQLIRQVVQRKVPGLEPMTRLPATPGTWKGLWATVRDLKDAVVVPKTALKAVGEAVFEEEDRPWLHALFTLHAAMLEAGRSLGVGSPDDISASLSDTLSGSPFLKGLKGVFYYGFYDLSQVQLSFFEAVTRRCPVTLYFPLGPEPAYGFARRFFERHLLPLAQQHEERSGEGEGDVRQRIELTVTSVIGVEEELATVCREILTLVEVNGYRFDEIGVVGRSLEAYQPRLQALFDRHLVPFTSTAGCPLLREPLVKSLLRLASLPLNSFDRTAMLDVLASPFYRTQVDGKTPFEPRPDMWRLAVSTLGIVKGEADWARLAADDATSILQEAAGDLDEEDHTRMGPSDPAQVRLLWSLASRLIDDCRALPQRGAIGRLTESFLALVQAHFVIPGWTEPSSSTSEDGGRLLTIGSLFRASLERLRQLDQFGNDISWEEWHELFRVLLEETAIPIEGDPHRGVQVLDAMTARGLRFRALFLIGMNEQVFPRYVREDPFLRDRQRLVLESTLGFKIDEKLAGHDEERLLFELLSHAVTHRVYLSYQRADEGGRVMTPSAFVSTALRDPRFVAKPERTVPRRLSARLAEDPAMQDILPAQDLALGLLFHGQDAGPLVEGTGKDRMFLERGQTVLVLMERESSELGAFDGMLDPHAAALPMPNRQGLSPTSLERYATCPFQYFAEKVLHLEPVRQVREDHLPPLTLGTLIHEALRLSYERLLALQWPDSSVTALLIRSTVTQAVADVFTAHAATKGTGHTLLWTLAQEQVTELVVAAASSDEEEYRTTGFRPHAFERGAEGVVPLGENMPSLNIHGTLDRIDIRPDPPSLRIVDYKYKQGSEMKTEDRNLYLAAARGLRLQPPLYASMRLPSLPAPSEVQFIYLAPRWEKPIARSIFDASGLLGNAGGVIMDTLRTLARGIERREFFILPDGYCDHCAFPAACRRHDHATWWRSYRSPQARVLRRLRKQKASDE